MVMGGGGGRLSLDGKVGAQAKFILKYHIHYQRYKGAKSIFKKILLDFCLHTCKITFI